MEGTKKMGRNTSAITTVSIVGEVERKTEPLVIINSGHFHHFISVPFMVLLRRTCDPEAEKRGPFAVPVEDVAVVKEIREVAKEGSLGRLFVVADNVSTKQKRNQGDALECVKDAGQEEAGLVAGCEESLILHPDVARNVCGLFCSNKEEDC